MTADIWITSTLNDLVRFGDTVDGDRNLTVVTGGRTLFLADVGVVNRLRMLNTDATGQTVFDLANIHVGALDVSDATFLSQDVQIDATTSVRFGNMISGNTGTESLMMRTGAATIDGEIISIRNLALTATLTILNGDLTLVGQFKTDAVGTTKLNMGLISAADVQFHDAVEICQDVSITAEKMLFGRTIDEAAAATGSDLLLTVSNPVAASGDVAVNQAIGRARRIESLTITAANDVSLLSTIETWGSVTQNSGTGTTTLNGTGPNIIGGHLSLTSNDVTFCSSDITTAGTISVSATNQILFKANAGLNSSDATISLRANQDGTGHEGLIQQDGAVIRTSNTTTNAVRMDVAGSGSASVGEVHAAGRVIISAGGSIIDHSAAETANISADSVILQAQTGIGTIAAGDINTNVASLEAVSFTGGIVIAEAGDISIGGVTGSLSGIDAGISGNVQLTAVGSITIAESVHGSDDISVRAEGTNSDIHVTNGSGVTSLDGAVLLSADQTVTISDNVSTGSFGTLTITGNANAGARNVIVQQGATVSVVNGDLTIDADQGSQQSGNFAGVRIDGAEVRTSGSAKIVIDGRGGNSASGSQSGVLVTNSGIIRSSSTIADSGSIQIHGIGGTNTGNDNEGIVVLEGGRISGGHGDIQLTGLGGSGGGDHNDGIVINAGTVLTTGTSTIEIGDAHLIGTKGAGGNSNAIVLSHLAVLSVANPYAINGATLTLESTVGDVIETSGAAITANNLALIGNGNFALAESNQVGTMAADIDGTLDFGNAFSLLVGTAGSTNGIQSNHHDIRLSVDGNLQLGDTVGINGLDDISVGIGGVSFHVVGHLTPQAGTAVHAGGVELRGSGSVLLEETGNAVSTFAADFDGSIRLQTSSALTIGSTAGPFAVTSGITTQNDEVTICAASIQLTNDVRIGTGTLRLQAASGTIIQSAGRLMVDTVGARAATGITLDSAGNDVRVLAADSGTGSLVVVDADGFIIGSVSALGCCSADVVGVTTGRDLEVCVASGDIHVDAALSVTGIARLEATVGNVTSSAAGVINARDLAVRAAGNVLLDHANNQIRGIFVADSTSSGDIRFRDINGFTVASVASGACVGAVSGVVAADGNIFLTTDDGDLVNQTQVHSRGGNIVLSVNNAGDIVLNGTTAATDSGHILMGTEDGSIYVNGTVDSQAGNIRLNASGNGRDLEVKADVSSQGGHVTFLAADSLTTSADVEIQTNGAGSVFAEATNGSVTMNIASSILTSQGSIRLYADLNVTVSDLVASTGNVSLISHSGSVLDADPDHLDLDVQAASLRMSAAVSIGTLGVGSNALETSVNTVSARAGSGGVNVLESDGLTIDMVSVTSHRVHADGTTTAFTDLPQSDVVTVDNGSVVLTSQAGDIALKDGTDGNGRSIQVSGSGNVRLETMAANGDLIADASIHSGSGQLTIIAADDVVLNSAMSTSGLGTVFVQAGNGFADSIRDGLEVNQTINTHDGDILLLSAQDIHQNTAIISVDGNVGLVAFRDVIQSASGDLETASGSVMIEAGRDWTMSSGTLLHAGGDFDGEATAGHIHLGQIVAASVALSADGTIADANANDLNVSAVTLSMRSATGSIGGSGIAAIDTQVHVLAAFASGMIAVQESDGLHIDSANAVTVTVDIQRVNTDAGPMLRSESRTSQVLSDLTTSWNGDILLQSTRGSIVLNDGVNGDLIAVSAHGTGNVVVETMDSAGDITAEASIISATGHLTVKSGDDMDVNAGISTTGAGSIFLLAANGTSSDVSGGVDGINVNARISTARGDILIDSQFDLDQTALIESLQGSIGLEATRDVLQSASGDMSTTTGDVLVAANRHWTMSDGTTIFAGGGEFVGRAVTGSIVLGQVQATHCALSAEGDVVDANNAVVNVLADNLCVRSATGSIGEPGTFSIETMVQTLAVSAATGISINETDGLAVDHVASVTVTISNLTEIHFDGRRTAVSASVTSEALNDLTTTNNGDIRLQSGRGNVMLSDGGDADQVAVFADGHGNVLIRTMSADGDLIINAGIRSAFGSITADAGDDVVINASVETTNAGTILIDAANGSADAVTDGVELKGRVQTNHGDILIRSSEDICQTGMITSNAGDVALIAARDVVQSATGDVTAGNGDVLIEAGRNWTMSNGTMIFAGGGEFDGKSVTGNISLGQIESGRIALSAVGGILDVNDAGINVTGTSLSLRAGLGAVGGPGVNAIETQIETLAASAATGIAIDDVDGFTVDQVAAVSVTIGVVQQVLFTGSTTAVTESRSTNALSDVLTTNSGSILLSSLGGTIALNDGGNSDGESVSAHGTGNVLIQTQGAAGDIQINSGIRSEFGHVTISAGDDAVVTGAITTGGSGSVLVRAFNGTVGDAAAVDGIVVDASIQPSSGDMLLTSGQDILQSALVESINGDLGVVAARDIIQTSTGDIIATAGDVLVTAGRHWLMSDGAGIVADGGDFEGQAQAGRIELGRIQSLRVGLNANDSISDANSAALNVVAGSLSLRSSVGAIGSAGTGAIDTQVNTLAAGSAMGISISESDGLTVDNIAANVVTVGGVRRVNFDGTTTVESVSESSSTQSDLSTTLNGSVRLQTATGSLVLNDGFDGNATAISANGTGDILVQTLEVDGDVTVEAQVQSNRGHITIISGDDVLINGRITTTSVGSVMIAGLSGTIEAIPGGVLLNAEIATELGDILIRSGQDIQQNSLITSAAGDVGLHAAGDLSQSAT
ncbi:MAG: beta strand repeat-containing protein, partial [Planctomycetota bacterium]